MKLAAWTLLLVSFSSCGPRDRVEASAPLAGEGALRVRVSLNGEAPPPPRILVDKDTEHCHETLQDPVLMVEGGGVGNAVVWIELDDPQPSSPESREREDIQIHTSGCLLTPRIQVARVGDRIELATEDEILHNPHGWLEGRTFFNITLQPGTTRFHRTLRTEGLYRIDCDTHKWMKAYIHVLPHPHGGVTDSHGTVVLSGVPAGHHHVRIWHEVLGEASREVTITDGETTIIEVSFEFEDHRSDDLRPRLLEPWPPEKKRQ